MPKVRVTLYLEDKTWNEIRALAWTKRTKFKGSLSDEVEQCFEEWLQQHTQKSHIFQGQIVSPKIFQVWNQIKVALSNKYEYIISNETRIPRQHIQEAIGDIRGSDLRTIRKWMGLLQRRGFVKEINPSLFEVVMEA